MPDPVPPRAAALEAARAMRNAVFAAAWSRREQAITAAEEAYVAECERGSAAFASALAGIDREVPPAVSYGD